MNARGILTAAYQVLHLLSCMQRGIPARGVPIPARGYPQSDLAGVSPLSGPGRGNPPVRPDWGPLHWTWLGYPRPQSDLTGVPPHWTWLGYPLWDLAGVLPLDLAGVPHLPVRPGWGTPRWTWLGYPLHRPIYGAAIRIHILHI